jgi:short-subunit dehydrogenase
MKWALIAGGSKGLGFSIANALAKRKYNILLIARNQQELIISKEKLQTHNRIQVEILACDLSLPESADTIYRHCLNKGLEINILCNAAGLGGAKDFQDLPLNELRTMVRTNFESSIALSFLLIPLLKQSAPSYILNIGSLAGFAPIPIKSIYASTKSALHFFSYSLRNLLRQFQISVTLACPGPIFTKPSIEAETIHQLGWFGKKMAVKPEEAGEWIVRAMLKGKMIFVPGKLAKLVSYLLRMVPKGPIAHLLYNSGKKSK